MEMCANAAVVGPGRVRDRPLDPARLGDHIDRLYRAAWALTGSRQDAEDLVQETYARVLARPRFLYNEDHLGYLLRALRNTFLTGRRAESRRLRTGPLPDELGLVADPHARDPQSAVEAGELYAAVAALPADLRDVLAAVDVTGLTYREAARALRIPIGTVMSRLYRARQQVVRRLEPARDALPAHAPDEHVDARPQRRRSIDRRRGIAGELDRALLLGKPRA